MHPQNLFTPPVQHRLCRLVHVRDAPLAVYREKARPRRVEHLLRLNLSLFQFGPFPGQLEFVDDGGGKLFERGEFSRREAARDNVECAERTDGVAERRAQRHAGIKADAALSDERMVGEPGIPGCVLDHERLIVRDSFRAEGGPRRTVREQRLGALNAEGRLVPEPVGVGNRDDGHRHPEGTGDQSREAVEALLWRRIQNLVAPHDLEALRVVDGAGSCPDRWRLFHRGEPGEAVRLGKAERSRSLRSRDDTYPMFGRVC